MHKTGDDKEWEPTEIARRSAVGFFTSFNVDSRKPKCKTKLNSLNPSFGIESNALVNYLYAQSQLDLFSFENKA